MAAGAWTLLNDFKLKVYQKLMDLESDAFKVALALSTSNIVNTLTPSTYADLTHEVANVNGYTTGGLTAANPTLSGGGSNPVIDFDLDNVTFTASGGSIVARYAVLYDVTSGDILAYCLLDVTGADFEIPDGFTQTIQVIGLFSGR